MLKTTNVDLPLILLFLFTAALVNRRLNIGCLVRCLNINTCPRLYGPVLQTFIKPKVCMTVLGSTPILGFGKGNKVLLSLAQSQF